MILRVITIVLALQFSSAGQAGELSLISKGQSIIKLCAKKITSLDGPQVSKNADRAHVYLYTHGFGVVFARGSHGRTDYYDMNYHTIMSCFQNGNNEVVYLKAPLEDPLFTGVKPIAFNPENVTSLGAIELTFSYINGDAIFVESVVLPNTLKKQGEWIKEQEKRWTKR
jgi:hypothetical protein